MAKNAGIAAALGMLSWTLIACGSPQEPTTTTKTFDGENSSAVAQANQPAMPSYTVLQDRPADGVDGSSSYYVVIDPIEPAGGFKEPVKLILKALSKKVGGPNFSAFIWDNEAAAQMELKYKNNGSQKLGDDQVKARIAADEQHHIATYGRGLGGEYTIFWFPKAVSSPPNGRSGAVDIEDWTP